MLTDYSRLYRLRMVLNVITMLMFLYTYLYSTDPRVAGSFNSWSTTADQMMWIADWNNDKVFERVRSLSAGTNQEYKIYVDDWTNKWWGAGSGSGGYPPQLTSSLATPGVNIVFHIAESENYVFQFRGETANKFSLIKRQRMYCPGGFNGWNVTGSTMTNISGNIWRITITTGVGNYGLKFVQGQTYDFYHWGWEGVGSHQSLPHWGYAYRGPSWGSGIPNNILFTISEGFVTHTIEIDLTNMASPWYRIKESSPPAAVTTLFASTATVTGDVTLSWISPGDNGWSGTLPNSGSAKYVVQFSTYHTVIWSTAAAQREIIVSGVAPLSRQVGTITGISGGTTVYFRLWTRDESDNYSDISNGATIYVPSQPPYAPSELKQFAGSPERELPWNSWTNDNTIKLQFFQSDINPGERLRYIINISTYSDFSFIYFTSTSVYLSQGTTNFVTPLLPDATSWYWRVRSQDEFGELFFSQYSTAALGGVAFRIDTVAPAAISNLTALTGPLDGDVNLKWTAPGDNGTSGNLIDAMYEIKIATFNITSELYDSVTNNPPFSHIVEISTTNVVPGSEVSVIIRGILYPGTTWYFAIKTKDKAGNYSSWSTAGVNTANFAPAQDLVPSAPPGIVATSLGTTLIEVTWDLPFVPGYNDITRYELFRATFVFTSTTTPNVSLVVTKEHPSAYHLDTVTPGNTYYYRVRAIDKGPSVGGLFSIVHISELSVIASTYPFTAQPPVITVVYDDRSELNKNNYGIIDGIEDADGIVSFTWSKALGSIANYFVEISSDKNFTFFSSSRTLPGNVSTFTVSGLTRGVYHYCRVKARTIDGVEGPWCVSDGIYVNRKMIDSSLSDWGSSFATVVNSVTVSTGDALWRDAISDQRTDQANSSQLDISSVGITCDEYNLYLFVAFASTVSAGFDGRNFIQIMIDNDLTSPERVFRGRGDKYEDSYVAKYVPWEWICEIVTGNDVFRVEDSMFSNRKYGRYSEHNANYFYEVAIPLSYLGGKEKFLGKTVNFTIATFWNGGGSDGSVGNWSYGVNSNIVDVITSTGPNTWNEVSDRIVDFYLSVSFSPTGRVISSRGIMTTMSTLPDEPEPPEHGISPAPPSALDLILYNIFIDAFDNGDPSNDDIADINDYGGDFQGVINRVDYLNELGINVAYFGPPYEFGGGIWGFNIDDPFKFETKFGGVRKYIEMVKTLHNHNIKVMNDWVCGQVGSKNSPAAVRNPDFYKQEQFGWGTKQEFAEARAYYINNAVWAFSTCDMFRYDNPKFWNDSYPEWGFGWEAYEFNRALRRISDRWDPQLFLMGEIPVGVDDINPFTGSNGPMLHGGQAMRLGGYKDNRDSKICSWVRPGSDQLSTPDARAGITYEDDTGKNPWAINPVMMENHDEKRFISRGRALLENAPWHQQVGYMTAFTVSVSPILFYGGEVGLEGPYDGWQREKMDRGGNVRPMPWERLTQSPWNSVLTSIRRVAQARMNFRTLRGDPKKGSRSWYTGGQYDGNVLVFVRQWDDGNDPQERIIVMMNRSNSKVTLSNVGTGKANTKFKDWLTDNVFVTDSAGNIGSIEVDLHYGRILVQGTVGNPDAPDPYDWANVTGTVTDVSGVPIPNAIVDIDGMSHWTTRTDVNGYYSLSGDLRKVLTGVRTVRAWAPGYNIVKRTVNITNNPVNNNVSFTGNYALTVDTTPPAAPTTLSGRPRDRAVMLFWQPNTEEDIQTYLIYRSSIGPIPDNSHPEPIFEVFKTFYYDSDLDTKLTNGVTYYYRIRAVDRNGNKSAFSNQIAIVPRKVKVKFWLDTRDSGLTVNKAYIAGGALTFSKTYWEPVELYSNGDGTYERTFEFDDTTFIEYKYVLDTPTGRRWEGDAGAGTLFLDGSLGTSNRGELMDDAVPDVEIIDEGDGTMTIADVWRYYYDRPPRRPTGVQLSPGVNMITVGWTKNVEPDLLCYWIDRSTAPNFTGEVVWLDVGKDETSYVDTNLPLGVTYYYRIRAVDKKRNVSEWSSTVSAFVRSIDTTPPAAPSGIKACGWGNYGLNGIKISWVPNTESDLYGYNIYRSTEQNFSPALRNKLNPSPIPPTESPYFIDTNVTLGMQYYYKLVAVDDSGNVSIPSVELPLKLLPITFEIDMGNINCQNVQILGDTEPLNWYNGIQLNWVRGSSWSVTLGMVAGSFVKYQYAYNNSSVKEQHFPTSSKYREWTIPGSTFTKCDDWEEEPEIVKNVYVLPGVNKAYIYWDKDVTAEDILGYNIYSSVPPSTIPTIKVNPVPVGYSQPYTISGLVPNNTYYFSVKTVDSGFKLLESTFAVTVSCFISSPVYVNFGVPFSVGHSSYPWGDSTKLKMYIAIKTSTDIAVWNTPERADVTSGKMEMESPGDGVYRITVPLLKRWSYNFLFFAETTGSPPDGLRPFTEYYDTVPNTGTFIVSSSSTTVIPVSGVVGAFTPVGPERDARRLLYLPPSLQDGSTIYVFANFGSTPTAPTYINAIAGNRKITLYWSAPYGAPWVTVRDNSPVGGAGESMKAVDVICGGVYHIFMTTYNPGSFSSYVHTVTVNGNTFSYTFSGLENGVTYYFLLSSSDTFKGLVGNNYSTFSSTVSAVPTSATVVAKIRVNRGARFPFSKFKKFIAMQEGNTIPSWDAPGRSNMTPTGRAVELIPPEDDPEELEFSVNLVPNTTYNFILFTYSTFPVSGILSHTTYYDTVPNDNTAIGMLVTTSTSTISVPAGVRVWGGNIPATGDARRFIYIPQTISPGTTIYVYCNFSSSPSYTSVTAQPYDERSISLWWCPYGAWGSGSEQVKAVDVIAGGWYYIYRSTQSPYGPYYLWYSTSGSNMYYIDDDREVPGDNLGLLSGVRYYYVVISSDAYTGTPGSVGIVNMYRSGAPEFSNSDTSTMIGEEVPTYFKVKNKQNHSEDIIIVYSLDEEQERCNLKNCGSVE